MIRSSLALQLTTSWGIAIFLFVVFTVLYFYVFKVHLRNRVDEETVEEIELDTSSASGKRKRAGSLAGKAKLA